MNKKSISIVLLLLLVIALCEEAGAQGTTYNSPAATCPFGIGIMLGEPTGVVAKYYLSNTVSLDGALAWSFIQGGFLYTQLDLQYALFNLLDNTDMRFPFYAGAGARLRFAGQANTSSTLGVLIPLGVNFIFRQLPIDAFMKTPPVSILFPIPILL
jgi:hypothetical protein